MRVDQSSNEMSGQSLIQRNQRLSSTDKRTEEQGSWVMTYMDLVTLLLTLFIFLALNAGDGTAGRSAEELRPETGKEIVLSEESLPEPQDVDSLMDGSGLSVLSEKSSFSRQDEFTILEKQLIKQFYLSGVSEGVEIQASDGGLQVDLSAQVLFKSGEAYFNVLATDVIQPLVEMFLSSDHYITIEGHTDNVPISNSQFPSNWELSSSRASHLVRYMISEGIESDRLRAIGYADTRPIDSNVTAEGRARNRRVTFQIRGEAP